MDAGDLIFYGMIAVSVVASIVKSVKKKQEAATLSEEEKAGGSSSDGSEWIKNVMRETTKSLFDVDDDDFIPRNPSPAPAASRPATTSHRPEANDAPSNGSTRPAAEDYRRPNQATEDYRRTNQSAETFRRPNQSAERFTRKPVSLEDKYTSKTGQISRLKQAAAEVEDSSIIAKPSLLSVSDDLDELQEVRKAVIYGEIMRPKF